MIRLLDQELKVQLCTDFEAKVLVWDLDHILDQTDVLMHLMNDGFKIERYEDIEAFRYIYETKIKGFPYKTIVVIQEDLFVPYDIRQAFFQIHISLSVIFPHLNTYILKNKYPLDLEWVYVAHQNMYKDYSGERATLDFLKYGIYAADIIKDYTDVLQAKIQHILTNESHHRKWFQVAYYKAKINHMLDKSRVELNLSDLEDAIQKQFKCFILGDYKTLYNASSVKGPMLISRCMDYIFRNSKKFAIIVMDGMSIENWLSIANNFEDIEYSLNFTFAMIPSITAISRQSLLSGVLPQQLESPFNLSKEPSLFKQKCLDVGYTADQIKYVRGYTFDLDRKVKALSVIINDIDDSVHAQLQGTHGLLQDMEYLAEKSNLQLLIKKLHKKGFEVYITSDHGNTWAECMGNIGRTGVEVETKCQRAIIYKDYASLPDTESMHNLIPYPGTYLPKDFQYFICDTHQAFGKEGTQILTHGGINIEEVIVPFIKIDKIR